MSRRFNTHKIILIGDAAVGKTTLRKNYMGENIGGNYLMTIGADFSVKRIEMDGEEHMLQIWDLAGQRQFGAIIDGYIKGTKGILLVFALNNHNSFNNLDGWINDFLQKGQNEMKPIIILGNKSDLPDRAVESSQVDTYMEELRSRFTIPTFHVHYFETNALSGDNVSEAFYELSRIIIENKTHFS